MVSSAAAPPESRREERDIIININNGINNGRDQGPPASHEQTREAEAKMLAQVNKTLETSKVASLKDAKIGSARMLPSGDWRFSTAIPRWTELLRMHHGEWVRVVGSRASIAVLTYGVIVDGIRVDSINQNNWNEVIEQFRQQNSGILYPDRKINGAHWLTKPKRNFCSLVIEFTEAADCNAIVAAQELFWNNQLRKVRRFVPGCNINQCFKCHKYGHRSTQCKNPSVCGYCADSAHMTAACPSQSEKGKPKCAVCAGSHPSWSADCKERKEQKKKVREKAESAPKFWAETVKTINVPSISPGPSVAPSVQEPFEVPRTAGAKRPLQAANSSRSNARTKNVQTPTAIPKSKIAKVQKTKATQRPVRASVSFGGAQKILDAATGDKENQVHDTEMEEGEVGQTDSQLSTSIEGSGGPFTRFTRGRRAVNNIDIFNDSPYE